MCSVELFAMTTLYLSGHWLLYLNRYETKLIMAYESRRPSEDIGQFMFSLETRKMLRTEK